MPENKRNFATLREAIRYMRAMPHGSRYDAVVRAGRRKYDAVEIEQLELEMRRQR